MLLKEIKEDQTKYRNIPYLLIGIFSTLKISALPRFTYRFSAIPIRIRADFLNIEIDKYMWKARKQRTTFGGLIPVYFKTH